VRGERENMSEQRSSACTNICIIHIYVYIYMCVHVCMYIYMRVCMCMYAGARQRANECA